MSGFRQSGKLHFLFHLKHALISNEDLTDQFFNLIFAPKRSLKRSLHVFFLLHTFSFRPRQSRAWSAFSPVVFLSKSLASNVPVLRGPNYVLIIRACLEVGPVSAAFVTACQQLSLYVYFWCLFMACPIRAREGTPHQKTIDKSPLPGKGGRLRSTTRWLMLAKH